MTCSSASKLGAQMEMQIQAAMVDALQADDDVAVLGGFLDAGEAGHAADRERHGVSHGFTSGSDRNCSSWSRW